MRPVPKTGIGEILHRRAPRRAAPADAEPHAVSRSHRFSEPDGGALRHAEPDPIGLGQRLGVTLMSKGRLEAFSDGVIAIIITIMVLELRPPAGAAVDDLLPLVPTFISYLLSFALLGTWWNNHHHLLQAAKVIDAKVLWANLALLFSLSLFPFGTAWVGQSSFAPTPVAAYGALLLLAAVAFYVLIRMLIAAPGQPQAFADAIGRDVKGKISPALFAIAIPVALVLPAVSMAIYVLVVLMWIVPDRRMERVIRS